jgi:dUTP pyrophosphatase
MTSLPYHRKPSQLKPLSISKPGATAMDLCSAETVVIAPGAVAKVWTGISLEIPEGMEGQIRSCHHVVEGCGLVVVNSPGTVPVCHKGELYVLLGNIEHSPRAVIPGDKIALLAICPIVSVVPQEISIE